MLLLILLFAILYILIHDLGSHFQKKYLLSDAYELMNMYSTNTNDIIEYRYFCFLYSGKHKTTYKCKFAVSNDCVYIKLAYWHPHLLSKRLQLQVPKKDLVFLQKEKKMRVFLFFAGSGFYENDYNRYNIVNSTVSILFLASSCPKVLESIQNPETEVEH